jgi:AraC-like DNA-binding protein
VLAVIGTSGNLTLMKVSQPISVTLPAYGVLFAESVHATDFRMPERVDPFRKVFYVLAGCIRYRAGGAEAEVLPAGTVVLVPRGQPHQLEDVEASTLLLLCLTDAFVGRDPDLPDLWAQLVKRRRLDLNRPARERAERMWRRAMLEKTHAHVGGGVTVRTLAAQLLVLLARQHSARTPDAAPVRVAAVARELRETFYDDWNVDRAAARAAMSRRRFTELFRSLQGRSFAEELQDLRLAHAARLLQGGEHSVLGVMFSCGFSDVSHFYRLFRVRYGAPPKRWVQEQMTKVKPKSAPR